MRSLVALALILACSSDAPPPIDAPINKPVTDLDRSNALGDVSSLAPAIARAFDATDFTVMRTPHANDWLDTHYEAGQTLAQHQSGKYPAPDDVRRVLYLLPLGELSADSPPLADLARVVHAFFGLEVRILPAVPLVSVEAKRRGVDPLGRPAQLLTSDVHRWLVPRLPGDAQALIAVTMMDLYPAENLYFVFGQAAMRDRVAVQSFARIDPTFYGVNRKPGWQKLMLVRAAWTMIHELGHTFGLHHCIYYECVFAGVNSRVELDRFPLRACPICLRKLYAVLGFDLATREDDLASVFGALGVEEEAAWSRRRATWIRTGTR